MPASGRRPRRRRWPRRTPWGIRRAAHRAGGVGVPPGLAARLVTASQFRPVYSLSGVARPAELRAGSLAGTFAGVGRPTGPSSTRAPQAVHELDAPIGRRRPRTGRRMRRGPAEGAPRSGSSSASLRPPDGPRSPAPMATSRPARRNEALPAPRRIGRPSLAGRSVVGARGESRPREPRVKASLVAHRPRLEQPRQHQRVHGECHVGFVKRVVRARSATLRPIAGAANRAARMSARAFTPNAARRRIRSSGGARAESSRALPRVTYVGARRVAIGQVGPPAAATVATYSPIASGGVPSCVRTCLRRDPLTYRP